MQVPASTSATVAVLPSSRVTGMWPRSSAAPEVGRAAGSGAGGPAGIRWLGMSSRMCWNAQRWNGGSCQLARVTWASGAGGKPVMSSGTPSGDEAGVCGIAGSAPSWVMVRTLTHLLYQER